MNQVFEVQGMSCGHCATAVTAAVKSVDPAAQVKVDLGGGKVEVETTGDRGAIAHAIQKEGYTVVTP